MTLPFMADASSVMLVGPNGMGKSMLACNLGH
jgi:ABC-type cobalamin/Fe3+-siderophores transport system ATPase subunit